MRHAIRHLLTGIGWLVCAASALISLAVTLAFFSERSDLLDGPLSSRQIAMLGVALFLVAVAILALEARKARRIKAWFAAASLLCAAAGALLIWTASEEPGSVKDDGASLAQGHSGQGSGWMLRSGSGRSNPKAHLRARKDRPAAAASSSDSEESAASPSEGAEAQQSTSPPPACVCPPPQESAPPSAEVDPPPYTPPVDPEPVPPEEDWESGEEDWESGEEEWEAEDEWEEDEWEEEW